MLPTRSGRTYREIVRENVLSFVNVAILSLGVALAALGEPTDALVSIGVVMVNVAVGAVQEIRAKILLDRIALLVRPAARVVRDGIERELRPSELVVGDVVRIAAGDQILADSVVIHGGPIEMDESLLTGESPTVTKFVGDALLSGTFCAAGSATVETKLVGEAAFANRVTAGARSFRRVTTPLQQRVDTIIRGVLLVAISFALVLVGSWLVERGAVIEGVRMAMVIAGLVPNGLLLAASAAYAMSAARVARRGVLAQQANAIDSLSHVEVLCMDKTGTLTTGRARVARLDPSGISADELRSVAGRFAASATTRDRTLDAIRDACPADPKRPRREIPFSATRRWSALELDADGVLVLGAPEAILRFAVGPVDHLATAVEERTADGLRVLVLARSDGLEADDPGPLRVLGLVCLAEDLRPGVRTTMERFAAAGIGLAIVSGDHPNTVRAIANAAGLDGGALVRGDEIERMTDEALRTLAPSTTLFARTTPHQKERIVRALRASGRYTAMVGDGINDVLALKAADLGIAMRGGAPSARAVAGMLLLDDEIDALVPAAAEGRRIMRGMRDILRIFLTRVIYAALVIAAIAAIEGGSPFLPTQNALLTLLTVGIPSLALAAWAPAEAIDRSDLGAGLIRMVIPAGWTIGVLGFITYVAVLFAGGRFADAQSALTTTCVLSGLLFFAFIADDDAGRRAPLRPDRRRVALTVVLLGGYAAILAMPSARALFDLAAPNVAQSVMTILGVGAWSLTLRWLLRTRALDAALGLGPRPL